MPKTAQPSYAALTHQVIQAAPEPLPFDEIMRRVQQLRPIDTKNPAGTIRSAIGQSRLIVNTGEGRYGWLLRLINGSIMRLTLAPADFDGKTIGLGEDTHLLLWPAFFEIQLRRDISPITLQLPDRRTAAMALVHLQYAQWGMAGPAEFWQWFTTLHAAPADHLLLHAVDGEQKLYAVEFQPRAARDEAAIATRNQAVVQAAVERLRRSTYGVVDWDLVPHLLATGQYRHPIPPDPLGDIWTEDIWRPVLEEKKPPSRMWVRIDPDEMEWDPYAHDAPPKGPLDDVKHSNRKELHRIWQVAQAGKPLRGEEAMLAEIMRQHTEWHRVWNRLDRISDAQLEQDGVNPVMHLVVHQTILNQINGALPPVDEICRQLLAQGIDQHEAIHRIGAVFMEEFYRALKADRPFDETRYLLQLKQSVRGKSRPLHREPRARRR